MGRFVNPGNDAFWKVHYCQYDVILLVGINYDRDSKEHQCVIDKYEK